MKTDPYAFTNTALMGDEMKPPDVTHARFRLVDADGKVAPTRPEPIPLDVWAQLLKDDGSREPSGYLKRVRMRTLKEVFADLYKALDVIVCNRCGDEKPTDPRRVSLPHKGCGGEYESFIDEYFSGPDDYRDSPREVPHSYRWVACYPVTGGSEGHYVHVDFMVPVEEVQGVAKGVKNDFGEGLQTFEPRPSQNLWHPVRLALGKTFRGMDHAAEMARRCAILLGA